MSTIVQFPPPTMCVEDMAKELFESIRKDEESSIQRLRDIDEEIMHLYALRSDVYEHLRTLYQIQASVQADKKRLGIKDE